MPTTYSPNLRVSLIPTGDQAGVWGDTTNTNLGTLLEGAISGYTEVPITVTPQYLIANDGAVDQARMAIVKITTAASAFTLCVPNRPKIYLIWNDTSYAATMRIAPANTTAVTGTGYTVVAGAKQIIWTDGTTGFYSISSPPLTATADFSMGGFKITNVATPTTAGDALAYGSSLGAVTATTGTFSGAVSGTTGTFSGAVSGTTGTFSGAVSGTTGTFTGNVQMASANGGQLAGLRNKIINGDMRVAQRGAGPFALTTTYSYLTVDRFFAVMATSAAGGMQQSTDAPTGFVNSLYFYRNSASALTGGLGAGQVVETINIYDLKGQTVTFSFYAKAAANFSSSGSSLSSQVITGTAANATSATLGSWAGQAATNQANTITTTWTRYSMTATIPSGALSLAVLLQWTPVGTAGTSDGVFVTGLQVEVGPVATPFEQRPIGMELALCQRYYWASTSGSGTMIVSGITPTAGYNAYEPFKTPVTMRAVPIANVVGAWVTVNATAPTIGLAGIDYIRLSTSAVAVGQFYAYDSGVGRYITADAEL